MNRAVASALATVVAAVVLCACNHKTPSSADGKTTPQDPDPHWVLQQTPSAKVALVYVHGVTGDMIGTWTASDGKKFWDLVNENESLKGKTDAFAFGFPSYVFKSGSFDIQQAANRLHERLQYHRVLSYPAVVFVAHSMGGLVVMRELLTHHEELSKVPVVMFYATPMEGSRIAEIGKEFSPNTALAEMSEADGNALLQQLNDEWRALPEGQRPHIRCAYENKRIGPAKVVPWASATRFCEGATPAIEATHMSIVKPDRPDADAIVYLANALNEYVLGKDLEPKLETPDFVKEGPETVFILKDSFGRQTARLLNEGGSPLRFTFAEISDPSLWLSPDDTPRDIPAHDRINMSIGLGRGATKTEYHFILRTAIQPDLAITVRVPDLAALNAQQEDSARQVAEQIRTTLSDPKRLAELQRAAIDDNSVPAAIVQIAHNELTRQNPQLSPSRDWVLTADLFNALNWPSLAANALQYAEKALPAIVQTPNVQFLSGVVALQSGEQHIFLDTQTPVLDSQALKSWGVKQPLTSPAAAELAQEVANSMERVPALKIFGLSLKGDVEYAKGNNNAARAAYMEAATIKPSPSVSTRLMAVEVPISNVERRDAEHRIRDAVLIDKDTPRPWSSDQSVAIKRSRPEGVVIQSAEPPAGRD